MAESILKLFEKEPPTRFAICGKGPSLDNWVNSPSVSPSAGYCGTPICVFAINDAVRVVKSDYWVWQDNRYQMEPVPDGCQPIRNKNKICVEGHQGGYYFTKDVEMADPFHYLRSNPKLALGIMGEWTTGHALVFIGEWLRRWKCLAEVFMVGCDSFDQAKWGGPYTEEDTPYAKCVQPVVPPEFNTTTDYSKSVEMLGLCVQQYRNWFSPLRWHHREMKGVTV